MGKRGPKKTPTEVLRLHGSQELRYRKAEPPAIGTPVPPAWLDDYGLEKWNERVSHLTDMGVLSKTDADALASYCEAYSEFRKATDYIRQHGHMAISAKGSEYQHPMVGIKNKAIERMNKLGQQFGWSPSSRADLSVSPQKKNALSEFLTG